MKSLFVPLFHALAGVFAADFLQNFEVNSFLSASLLNILVMGIPSAILLLVWLGVRYIPHNRVGVIEKFWSNRGSLGEGQIIALNGEAGYQANLLRGGLHFGYWRWQYRIHQSRLVTIPQNEIGYVYARDGESLDPSQTLARVVDCNHFQDAMAFLDPAGAMTAPSSANKLAPATQRKGEGQTGLITNAGNAVRLGQRGRQRAILREGVYAINPALFVVITERQVFGILQSQERVEREAVGKWQEELRSVKGFQPIVIGGHSIMVDANSAEGTSVDDTIGIVTIHDGPSLRSGELIAPPVGQSATGGITNSTTPNTLFEHNNFQDPEAFLSAGGRRGRQYQAITDGTYFINRWFATVETTPKTVVPIGHVGVVVSYYGTTGRGEAQRILQEGLAEASVLQRKIASYGDPRLFALTFAARELAQSQQPLVPERLFMTQGGGESAENGMAGQGMLGTLISLLVSERAGFSLNGGAELPEMRELMDQMVKESAAGLGNPVPATSQEVTNP